MKQDVSTTSEKPVKVPKLTKNLYEPYVTPRIVYNMLRALVLIVFSIASRVHLHGRYNIPRKGPFIVASNHLAWADVPLAIHPGDAATPPHAGGWSGRARAPRQRALSESETTVSGKGRCARERSDRENDEQRFHAATS